MRGCGSLTARGFRGATRLYTTVLSGNVDMRLGQNLKESCLPGSRSLSALRKGLGVSRSVGARALLGGRVVYACSRFSAGARFGRVVGSAVLVLLGTGVAGAQGGDLQGLLLFFSSIGRVSLHFMG